MDHGSARDDGTAEAIRSMGWAQAARLDQADGSRVFAWGLPGSLALDIASTVRSGHFGSGASGSVPDSPWVIVVVDAAGAVCATASPAYQAGLFWAEADGPDGPRLYIGAFLGSVVQALGPAAAVNEAFVASRFGVRAGERSTTPFIGVHRVPPGVISLWPRVGAAPTTRSWSGVDAWSDPTLGGDGVIDTYRSVFDGVLAQMVPDQGALAATLSGGLDSSFVVASLTHHASPDRPVHAFVHSPHPGAESRSRGNWDPDDYPVAMAMQRRYPDMVKVHRVIRDDDWQPLDEAERSARLLWYPPMNLFNHLWLRQIDEQACAIGAARVFHGSHGNPTFSDTHSYAAGYHLARGEWSEVAETARPYPGEVLPEVRVGPEWLARQLGSSAKQRLRGRRASPHFLADFLPHAQPDRRVVDGTPRSRYLRWLDSADHRPAVLAFAGWQAENVDPFATATMRNLAASIQPSAWARAGSPRGFARRVGAGRVPDEIRLRTRRGGQSWDAWYTMHAHRDRYVDAAEQLIADPVMGAWVNAGALREEVLAWPWGRPTAASPPRLQRVVDLLGFGASWRTLRRMVAEQR